MKDRDEVAEAIERFLGARISVSQREIDASLASLQQTGSPASRITAIRQLSAELDRVRYSPYHLEFEVGEEGFRRLAQTQSPLESALVLRTEPDGSHIVEAISSKEGGSIAASFDIFHGEPRIVFSWVSDSMPYAGHEGVLAIRDISAIRIVKTPATRVPNA